MASEGAATCYSVEEARELIAGNEGGRSAVIDLRGEEEFGDGHIPAAIRVEDPRADDLQGETRGRREVQTWLIVCGDGKRSQEVARELSGEGLTVGWLEGGVDAWISNRNPVQPPDSEAEFRGPRKKSLY